MDVFACGGAAAALCTKSDGTGKPARERPAGAHPDHLIEGHPVHVSWLRPHACIHAFPEWQDSSVLAKTIVLVLFCNSKECECFLIFS